MKKLHLNKITISRLSKEQSRSIVGGSVDFECDITKDRDNPRCDDFTRTEEDADY